MGGATFVKFAFFLPNLSSLFKATFPKNANKMLKRARIIGSSLSLCLRRRDRLLNIYKEKICTHFRKNPSSLNELRGYVEWITFREETLIGKKQKPVGELLYFIYFSGGDL